MSAWLRAFENCFAQPAMCGIPLFPGVPSLLIGESGDINGRVELPQRFVISHRAYRATGDRKNQISTCKHVDCSAPVGQCQGNVTLQTLGGQRPLNLIVRIRAQREHDMRAR
ncbi:hypothetical protein D3C81_1834500 [compost metagenome]